MRISPQKDLSCPGTRNRLCPHSCSLQGACSGFFRFLGNHLALFSFYEALKPLCSRAEFIHCSLCSLDCPNMIYEKS